MTSERGTGPGDGPGDGVRRALRVLAVLLAVVVTILAATVTDGWAGETIGRPSPGRAAVAGPRPLGPDPPGPDPPGSGPSAPGPPVTGTAAPGPQAPGPPAPGAAGPSGPGGNGEPGTGGPEPTRPPGAGRRVPGAAYAWPLEPVPAVLTPFRRPTFRFGIGHRGADLRGVAGQTVLAAGDGVVVFAGPVAGRAVVSVDHPDGLRTTYEPVTPSVRVGDRVAAGDPLGVLGAGHAGCAGAVCLHWGVRRGRYDYLDPLVLLRPSRLRLLPAGAG